LAARRLDEKQLKRHQDAQAQSPYFETAMGGVLMWPFGGPSVQKILQDLRQREAILAKANADLDAFNKEYPLAGSLGIVVGFGPAPPGFEDRLKTTTSRHARLELDCKRAQSAAVQTRQAAELQLEKLTGHKDPETRKSAAEALRSLREQASQTAPEKS
jgi:hypothetical protein